MICNANYYIISYENAFDVICKDDEGSFVYINN
jgi:hypothetical protein